MEKIFLGVLVDPQRDDVQRLRLGDLLDAALGRLHGWQSEVMA